LAELEKLEQQIEDLQASELKAKTAQVLVTNRMMLKFWLIGLFAIFVAYISFQSLNILYLILAAFIVSIAIEAIIDFREKTLKHRGIAIIISYLLVVILVLAGLFFIVPFLLSQLSQIVNIITSNIANIQEMFQTTPLVDIISQNHWIPKSAKEMLLTWFADPTVVSGVQLKIQENMAQLINVGTNYAKDL
jgi:predicted PurR-regulated permease PerM